MTDSFTKFRSERIRELKLGYPEVINQTITLKQIVKAYNRWRIGYNSDATKYTVQELEIRCEAAFGDSRGKLEYCHIHVFLDEEDVEEFDRDHQESLCVESDPT